MKTFVIAEFASCHDGSLRKALRGVELAKQMGADAYKVQWVSDSSKLAERRQAQNYLWAYAALVFPQSWHLKLSGICESLGLEYMCTTYLPEDIGEVAPYVNRFKISSFEADDVEFIKAHKPYKKPVIMSHGMSTGLWSDFALENVTWGMAVEHLHCVSAYPTPLEQMNLARIPYGFYQGLSDHSTHPWTGALAVAAGARIIEFHYRLADSDPSGADYGVARDPGQAINYIANIRTAEIMMGTGENVVQPAEAPYVRYKVKA